MKKKYEAIITDSDGTLIDTVHLIRHGQYEAARRYLIAHGIPDAELPDYESYDNILTQVVGGSARDTLEKTVRILYEASPHHLKGIDYDELHDLLNPVQDALAAEYIAPYEGLQEFLHDIGNAGVKLAIFTSGTPHYIVRNYGVALPELGLGDLYKDTARSDAEKLDIFTQTFAETYNIPGFTVITEGDTAHHKPAPDSLNLAMERLGATPEHSLVLGDHKVDMQAGVNAHVPTRVGVTHGFDDRETLLANGATHTADNLTEVAAIIHR